MNLRGARALVTGAAGFIGSHLVERLVYDGADVRALVRYRSDGRWGWLDHSEVKSQVDVRAGDLGDVEFMRQVSEGCRVVFHLGALISIPYSYDAPRSYVRTNVEGTLNVLEAARTNGVERFIHTSTSEVYGTPETVPITEAHPIKAQSPYSATKIGADKLAESFFHTWNLPVVIVRPFNTYGPRQSARAIVPTILSQLLAGAEVLQLGSLSPRRDLTYVTDTVDGFVRAARADSVIGRTIQLGTGRDVSIGELAHLAMRVVGRAVRIETDDQRLRPASSELDRLLSKPQLAADLLGWKPQVELEEGIRLTADWLQMNISAFRPERYEV